MNESFEQENVKDITGRIIALREACDYTQEEFANLLHVDLDTYRAYEENAGSIPISTICSIAKLCGVQLSEIMSGSSANLHTVQVVRKGEARSMKRYPGYKMEDMAYRFADKVMQPMMVYLSPENPPAAMASHSGQEFNLVLEGTVELIWGDRVFILEEGDSAYFDPTRPHGQHCAGGKPARFITIIAE